MIMFHKAVDLRYLEKTAFEVTFDEGKVIRYDMSSEELYMATQKAIGQLFDVDRSVVTKHLKNIYESGKLSATCANFAQVADNGKTYEYKFYSLSAIIAVC